MAWKRMDGIAVGVLALSFAATAAVYDRLPDPIATHFDLSGHPNGWMPRAIGAWISPAFGVGLWVAVRWLTQLFPVGGTRRAASEQVFALLGALVSVFLVAVHVLVLRYALTGATVTDAVFVLLGALFVGLGLVLPRVRRNAFIGVRTPWALASEENWARTQRVGGYAMVLSGVAVAIIGAIGGLVATGVALALLIAGGLVPVVYSLLLSRRENQGS
jgi:uncharacterized membrane protein